MSVCAYVCMCVYERVLYASESEGIRTYAHIQRPESANVFYHPQARAFWCTESSLF